MTTTPTFTAPDAAFVEDFRVMSQFGATENGGVDRQAATAADGEQRRWLTGLLEARGFTVKFDRAGNQWGLFEAVPGAPFVVVGSHMDSQPTRHADRSSQPSLQRGPGGLGEADLGERDA